MQIGEGDLCIAAFFVRLNRLWGVNKNEKRHTK